MKKLLLPCFLLVLATVVQSAEIEGCAAAEVMSHGEKFTFWQHQFEDGTRDLVMANAANDIKRVTFDKNKACAFKVLAIAEGANEKERWGWHLAWANKTTIYYARMDGEAWVSSVPKKIAAENASDLHFSQIENMLTLSWQAANGVYSMRSDDEGRSWSARKY